MTRDRWAQVTDLLGDLLDLQTDARPAFLARLHATDTALAAEVASLFEEHERPGEFLPDLPLPPQAAFADLSGRRLGAYRLIRHLGSGGMGSVYLAERSDGAFTKQTAVKLLSPAFAHLRERFHRERELLARLDHPNIARLLDGGTSDEGWPYLVMEYVEGVPIDRYCAAPERTLDERLALLLQVCAGVAHAHQRLIIHCDIKPENILVTADGTPKLLDFGIARLLDLTGHPTQFRAATPAYSSPEQLQGEALTTASDVYAIGVLGYVLLTGSWPYARRPTHLAEAVHAVISAEPTPPSRVAGVAPARSRRLRGDLDNVLLRAVAKEPNRRYASAQQLADDLEAFRRGFPVRARADARLYRLQRFVGRHRVATIAAVVSVGSLVAAVIFSTEQARIAERRFEDLREFARVILFDVDDTMRPIPGTTAARKLVVDTGLQYLDRLRQDASGDPQLREELAAGYLRVGKVQGGAFLPNLGDYKGAVNSFSTAVAIVGPNEARPALERLRIEAHINIAQIATDPIAGAPEFDRAIAAGERLLAASPDEVQTLRLLAQAHHGKATIGHLTDHAPQHEEHVAHAVAFRERIVALAPESWQDRIELAREYAQRALASMQRSDPADALTWLERGRTMLAAEHHRRPDNQLVTRGLAEIHSRTTPVLTSLGRFAEARREVDAAIALLGPPVASDAQNAQYRSDLASAWFRLGDLSRAEGRHTEALEWHRRALQSRRERAARDSSLMFVPWGLATSLNIVGELLLEVSPLNAGEAERQFTDASAIAEKVLAAAPSFNEVRKELAISYAGRARAASVLEGERSVAARVWLERSVAMWRDVFARSVGDRRQFDRFEAAERQLASLSAPKR